MTSRADKSLDPFGVVLQLLDKAPLLGSPVIWVVLLYAMNHCLAVPYVRA